MPEVLPAVALQQGVLYRLEVGLLIFYGWLLFVTPAFSGLIGGRLPIEVSTRGARFAEEADQSTRLHEKTTEDLEALIANLAERQRIADIEITRLKKATDRDNPQPPIGSRG